MTDRQIGHGQKVNIAEIGLAILLAAAMTIFFIACDNKNDRSQTTKRGGTLYFGLETPFHGFDVLGPGSGGILLPDMATVISLIQEPLFRMTRSGQLMPVLALSATASQNERQWDVVLRKNVRFHDGTGFDADAVVRHWARILDPQNKYRGRTTIAPIQSVEKIDTHTVRFHLAHPWPPFIKVISDPLYMFAYIPSPTAVANGSHNKAPVGTGPFVFKQWKPGVHFIVYKNEGYWQAGRPYLNKVVFRPVPDHQTRYAALLAGQLDVISLDRGRLIQKAQKDPNYYTYYYEDSGAEIVRINMRNPPLDDVRVRKALALANNQQLHIKMVYGDSIPFIHHPFGPWFKCPQHGYLEHDPEVARTLIEQYGEPLALELVHTNTSRGRSIGELLQQLYKTIGVTLSPVGLSTGPHIRKLISGDYQLATSRIYASNDFGPQLYRTLYSTSRTNYSGYSDPDMDTMLDAQRTETDPDKRAAILCRIIHKVNADVPFFYRGGRRQHFVARKKIMDLTGVEGMNMNLAAAWIDEAVKYNQLAFEIEMSSSIAIDCPDPGDTATVKAVVLGAWEGKDDWEAKIKATFHENDTISGGRTGSTGGTTKFVICQDKVHWEGSSGAQVFVRITTDPDQLDGQWQYAAYEGRFTLTRLPK